MASYIQIMVDSCFSVHSNEGIFLQMNVKNYARTIDHVKQLDLGPVVQSIVSLTSSLYPRHLCRGVYSFRLDVCPFVRSFVRSFVCSFVRYFPSRS